ncbi:hypothetical protein NCCP1664_24750 [Zafaria cholistanensis]|uniref:Uncharacterized protein n=2 Tax=Zafaria cholistanensis TaxID=1682741 RepID=A0A5A7NSY1_9MICC|nr:hypothetical protein NCCP1664_24750 [Zafaria cholistanensis]
MGNLKAVRFGSALAGFGLLLLLGAFVGMRLMMHVDAGRTSSQLTHLLIVASVVMLPALVLAVMTVWPVWSLEKSGPATKYQLPAVLAFFWFVVSFSVTTVTGL